MLSQKLMEAVKIEHYYHQHHYHYYYPSFDYLYCCFVVLDCAPSRPPYAYDCSIHSRSMKHKDNKSEKIFQYFIIYILFHFHHFNTVVIPLLRNHWNDK